MKQNDLTDLLIEESQTVYSALEKIDKNGKGLVFAVDSNGKLTGILTDGDVRRKLLKGINLKDPVLMAMNREFIAVHEDDPVEEIWNSFGDKYRFIPLVDKTDKLIDYWAWDFFTRIPIAEPSLNGNEARYIYDCLSTNWISSKGRYIEQFEEAFAIFCGTQYAITVMNGTASLHLALVSLGVGPGDEVIIPSLTFIATANAVSYTGATPVFVDCDRGTWTISPSEVEKAITPHTKGMIPVHLYGQPCHMNALEKIAKRYNLWIVEDAAEALGARYQGKPVGSLGEIGCFSFFGNKIITTGEGGMLVTDDPEIAARARMLRDHGMSRDRKYWHPEIGFNYRMTNLQAALGLAQMERIEDILKQRCRLTKDYQNRLSNAEGLIFQQVINYAESICWMFSVVLDESKCPPDTRDRILQAMEKNHIECRPFFYPIYKMPPYYQKIRDPNTEYLSKNGLNLPSFLNISEQAIDRVCEVLLNVLYEVV
ncbi:aminotransferase class I/II-fold pyridoxal phosphate-dependent enzyme [Thermodesulfobacteriota bacterium]